MGSDNGFGGALAGGPPQGIDMLVVAYRAEGTDDHHRPDIPWWQRPVAAVLGEDACGEVTGVQLLGLPVTDDDLRYLRWLPSIERINLSDTKVTDAGLKHLRACRHLTFLSLENTAITDAGLAELAVHQKLQGLRLNGTKVTDAGLVSLVRLPLLSELWLDKTAVTYEGCKTASAAWTECQIEIAGQRVTWRSGSPVWDE